MDTGDGYFKMLEAMEYEKVVLEADPAEQVDPRIFRVGEEVFIRESRFRVSKITPKKLILRLLPSKQY